MFRQPLGALGLFLPRIALVLQFVDHPATYSTSIRPPSCKVLQGNLKPPIVPRFDVDGGEMRRLPDTRPLAPALSRGP